MRGAIFLVVSVLSAAAALNVAFGAQRLFLRPERLELVRAVLVVWAALNAALFLVGRRWPRAAYPAHLYGAFAVLWTVFSSVTVAPLQAIGIHFAFQNVLLALALLLLDFRQVLAFTALTCAAMCAWACVVFPPASTSAALTYLLPATALPVISQGVLTVVASLLLERHHRRTLANQATLARHADSLERDVARRAEVMDRQQHQLMQMQKMEAVGALAAGVAHDFNNLLTPILSFARSLKKRSTPGDGVHEAAAAIERSGDKAAQLTRELLQFARRGDVQPAAVDVHALIVDLVQLLRGTSAPGIEVRVELDPGAPQVLGEPGQLQQVLLNLALNARDAMPDGGALRFRTTTIEVGPGDPRALVPGKYVALSVEDEGHGVPEEIRERIFEPFFTTKERGRGTGMGLAMVYAITKNHGGLVELESEVGRGSTFRVLLPAHDGAAVAATG